jgi:hypothetical protein
MAKYSLLLFITLHMLLSINAYPIPNLAKDLNQQIQRGFKYFAPTLSNAFNWAANKVTAGRIQDIEFVGDCDVKTIRSLIHGTGKNKSSIISQDTTQRPLVSNVLDQVPATFGPILLTNKFLPVLYYTFLSYQAYTQFKTPELVNIMRDATVNGKTFYTDGFELLATRAMFGIRTVFHKKGDRDAFFLEYKNDEQKLIVVSFRGSTTTGMFCFLTKTKQTIICQT